MAKTKTQETAKEAVDAPMGEEIKVKIKEEPKSKAETMKKLTGEDKPIKIDFRKQDDKATEEKVDKPKVKEQKENNDKIVEEVQEKVEEEKVEKKEEETEKPVLEEITEETTNEGVEDKIEEVKETVEEAVAESEKTGQELPENIQKVIDFMNETGGDLEDYVKLNQDYSKLDDTSLLREYYKQTKTHLNDDEISFLIEDSFTVDEEIDGEKDVKRKKLAFKEQVAHAKTHLDGLKSTYYKEIKSGVKLTTEQQKAIDFFNRYNKESKESQKLAEKQQNVFQEKTNNVFNNNFKGFEYNVGDKKYRFNVSDVNNIKGKQSDLAPWLSEYVDKNNILNDAKGYHKSLFTAMNADAVATHFYQQGKADGVKEITMDSKNINMDPRKTGSQEVDTGGVKYKVISGDDSNKLRFKINK